MDPRQVVDVVRAALPDDGVVCLDNGMYKIAFARSFEARQSNTLLLDNALATMGAGLPSGIGAKVLLKDTPVVCVCGDGGFMMNSAELGIDCAK
jgi:acetolactate synthase-1/2/3 large subunit